MNILYNLLIWGGGGYDTILQVSGKRREEGLACRSLGKIKIHDSCASLQSCRRSERGGIRYVLYRRERFIMETSIIFAFITERKILAGRLVLGNVGALRPEGNLDIPLLSKEALKWNRHG